MNGRPPEIPATVMTTTARIFDRNRTIDGTTMNERARACWSWAENRRIRVWDEHVAWGANAGEPRPPDLTEAVELCTAEGSALIVYSLAALSDDPGTVQWARRTLGRLPIEVVGNWQTEEQS